MTQKEFNFYFQMKGINLSRTKLSDDGAAILSTCMQNIEVINISECELTTNGIQSISKAIEQRRVQVLTLLSLTVNIWMDQKFMNRIGGSAKMQSRSSKIYSILKCYLDRLTRLLILIYFYFSLCLQIEANTILKKINSTYLKSCLFG